MGINHGRAYIRMPKQFLSGATIGACLQQVRDKTVAKRRHRNRLADTDLRHGSLHRPLQALLIHMVTALNASAWVNRKRRGWQDPEPVPTLAYP